MRGAVVGVLVLLRPLNGAADSCLADAIPSAERKGVNFDGHEKPLGIWTLTWDSSMLLSHLVSIVAEEKLGYVTAMGPGSSRSFSALNALAGCSDPGSGDSDSCVGDPPAAVGDWHLSFETWKSFEEDLDKKWESAAKHLAPAHIGTMLYSGTEGHFIKPETLVASLEAGSPGLDAFRSYDGNLSNPAPFFASIGDITDDSFAPCLQGVPSTYLQGYVLYFGHDIAKDNGSYTPFCSEDDVWWLSPACRNNASLCVPYVADPDNYGLDTMLQLAVRWNMPIAIATATSWEVFTDIVKRHRVMWYTFLPDPRFADLDVVEIAFPRHSSAQWARGLKVTQAKEQDLSKWAAFGLDRAAPDAYALASSLNVHLEDIDAMFVLYMGNLSYREAACAWLKDNTDTWQGWLPDPADLLICYGGQGLVDGADSFLNSSEGAVGCLWCPPGRWSAPSGGGSRTCVGCSAGRFGDQLGQSECQGCPAGRFGRNAGLTACERCGVGMYASTTENEECARCPDTFTTIGEGSERPDECVCDLGQTRAEAPNGSGRCEECIETFVPLHDDPLNARAHRCVCPAATRFDQSSSECVPCEAYLECPGGYEQGGLGIDTTVKVLEGYMSLPDAPFSVYACVSKEKCPGKRAVQSVDMCARSFDRHIPRCAVCQKGTFVTTTACERCGDYSVTVMCLKGLVTFLTQWAFVVQVYLRYNRPQTAIEGILGSIATFVQTLQVISRLDLSNPSILESFYQLLDTFTISGFFVRIGFKFDCFIVRDFRFSIYQQAVTPLIIFLNIGILQAVFFLRKRRKLNTDFVHNTVGLIFVGLFVLLVSMSMSLFYTVQMPNGKLMVVSFPELEYGSTEWISVLPVNFLSTLLYGVGTVSYVTYAVLTAPRRAATEPGFMARFRFCFGTKRPDRWWWVLVHLAFGVCVNLLQVLLPADIVQAQVCSSLVCTFLFTMIVYTTWPFKFFVNNYVETLLKSNVVIFLIFATSFIDSSKQPDEQLDRVRNLWGIIILVVIVSTLVITTYWLLKLALIFAEPIGISNVQSARTVWQLRDVAFVMLLLPESDFAKRLSLIGEHDTVLLKQATDRIIQIIFGQQASENWSGQRLIPGSTYQVWDHNKNVIDTLAQVRSGELQARLERSEQLRTRLIQMASAINAVYSKMRSAQISRGSISTRHDAVREVVCAAGSSYARAAGGAESGPTGWTDRIRRRFVSPAAAARLTPDSFRRLLSDTLRLSMPDEDADAVFALLDCGGAGGVTARDITGLLSGLAPEALVALSHYNWARRGVIRPLSTDEKKEPAEFLEGGSQKEPVEFLEGGYQDGVNSGRHQEQSPRESHIREAAVSDRHERESIFEVHPFQLPDEAMSERCQRESRSHQLQELR